MLQALRYEILKFMGWYTGVTHDYWADFFQQSSQDAWQVLLTASREVNLSVYLTALRSAPELAMIHLSNDFGSSAILKTIQRYWSLDVLAHSALGIPETLLEMIHARESLDWKAASFWGRHIWHARLRWVSLRFIGFPWYEAVADQPEEVWNLGNPQNLDIFDFTWFHLLLVWMILMDSDWLL